MLAGVHGERKRERRKGQKLNRKERNGVPGNVREQLVKPGKGHRKEYVAEENMGIRREGDADAFGDGKKKKIVVYKEVGPEKQQLKQKENGGEPESA